MDCWQPELAAGVVRVKGAKSKGVRVGNWLSVEQAQKLLNAPDISTKTLDEGARVTFEVKKGPKGLQTEDVNMA